MSNMVGTGNVVVQLRFSNDRSKPCTFALEPWGDTYPMNPGETFEVIAEGPAENYQLEVIDSDEHIIVAGWSGSVISVFHCGQELGEGSGPRPPCP